MKTPYRIALIMLVLGTLFAQVSAQGYRNKHPFDFKRFNLGFLIGMNYNAYNLKEQINVIDEGVLLNEIEVIPRVGITLGMITNLNLSEHFALRFIPSISLEQRNFDFVFEQDSAVVRKIEASYLNLPLMLQFRSKYHNAKRVYLLTGIQAGINLASNKKVRDNENLLKISPQDFSLVFGAGVNIYGDRIKLSPEIRYSMGLTNIFEPEFTSHADAISKLFSQVITININFE